MMRKFRILLFLFVLISSSVYSQKSAEAGVLLGRSFYLGELNSKTHWGKGYGNFVWGGVFRYNLNYRYSLKANFISGKLNGNDSNTGLDFGNFRRGSFESTLREFSAQIEFNFMEYDLGDSYRPFSPYLFVGFSIYGVDPNTTIDDVVVRESNGASVGLAFPIGFGFKLNLTRRIGLSAEWSYRRTSNDEIDGIVNVRSDLFENGKSYDNDWYGIGAFILTYKITSKGSCPSYNF